MEMLLGGHGMKAKLIHITDLGQEPTLERGGLENG